MFFTMGDCRRFAGGVASRLTGIVDWRETGANGDGRRRCDTPAPLVLYEARYP